jgi:RsmE family RNA methyltransferase
MGIDQVLASASCFDIVLAAMVPRECPPTNITDVLAKLATARTVLGLIGPEGGWTPAESETLLAKGACAVCLGPNVLRIETAAMAVAALVHAVSTATQVASVDLTS